VGRAFLFADCLKSVYDTWLVGPIFPSWGKQIWPPIQNEDIKIASFEGRSMPFFLKDAADFVRELPAADLIIICKPRLPAFYIAHLIAKRSSARLILDIDDYELAFFQRDTALPPHRVLSGNEKALAKPFGEIWTRYAANLIPAIPDRMVSSLPLQLKYGGTMMPHFRDLQRYRTPSSTREQRRIAYGFSPEDKIILFLGTPRKHKGLFEILDALTELGNPRWKLMIVGEVPEKELRKKLRNKEYRSHLIHKNESIPWKDIPEYLELADLVALLQDKNHPVSQYQLPAKLIDAIAAGVPVLANPVPPLEPFAGKFNIHLTSAKEPLKTQLVKLIRGASPPEPWSAIDYGYSAAREKIISIATSAEGKENLRFSAYMEELRSFFGLDTSSKRMAKARKRIDAWISGMTVPTPTRTPKVSIIILNRNGYELLKKCLQSIALWTLYPEFEVIVVDNGSTDGSLQYLKNLETHFPLKIIENRNNTRFSEGNNQAVSEASGEYILFLNNDVTVTHGWLRKLVTAKLNQPDAGALGASLIYPPKTSFKNSLRYQHRGIGLERRKDSSYLRPVNLKKGEKIERDYHEAGLEKVLAVTGACLLLSKTDFEQIQGFDVRYNYGLEDVDICLELSKTGRNIYLVKDCLLYHYEFGSQEKQNREDIELRRDQNKTYFRGKWEGYLNQALNPAQ
jgi:GT2 family glycosyltransferase/glycosyltransferase involved in cell wall biosynthesis